MPEEYSFRVYIKDDYDQFWYYEDGRITCFGDDTEDGGYRCYDLEDGYRELVELGYITEEPK